MGIAAAVHRRMYVENRVHGRCSGGQPANVCDKPRTWAMWRGDGAMDTTFYLIRHGKKASGIGDVPLSPEGRREAEATARHLHGRDIARVVHSPLARARETAEAI